MKEATYTVDSVLEHFPSVSHKSLRNWVEREQFFTPIERPGQGRARRLNRINVIEIAIAARLLQAGLTREHTSQAFRRRCAQVKPTGYAVDHPSVLSKLPELQLGADGWRWAVFILKSHVEDPKDRGSVVSTKAFHMQNASRLLSDHNDDIFVVVPISTIVNDADRLLAQIEGNVD